MDILDIIREKAFKPMTCLDLIPANPFQIYVKFEDDSIAIYKDSVALRMWAICIQNLNFKPILGNTDHCVESPLGFFNLLGFRSGDAILIQNEKKEEQPILFA